MTIARLLVAGPGLADGSWTAVSIDRASGWTTLHVEALVAMASEAGHFYRAIAVAIPCPPERFWGRQPG